MPESPTRCLKQFKRMFVCLKSLDKNFSDEKALKILEHLTESSIDKRRVDTLKILQESKEELTTNEIAKRMKIGIKTAKTELCVLWQLEFLEMREEEQKNSYGSVYNTIRYWKVRQNSYDIFDSKQKTLSPHQKANSKVHK
ncbi:MAG: hypothetical protein HY513_04410 [Candidatus Aenigmarchaeota archaeon]|nr:hypothetical protein [Candidatus Aenigmarchaeota archaeon]